MRIRMHSKSGIVNGLFPDRNRLVVIKVYPICSDVKTRKRRNVVGIDMIQSNRIVVHLFSCLICLLNLFHIN